MTYWKNVRNSYQTLISVYFNISGVRISKNETSMLLLRTWNSKSAFFKITPDCARMITIATIECGEANNYEFCNPYTLGSMLHKHLIVNSKEKIKYVCI